jgi:hypothetical protein
MFGYLRRSRRVNVDRAAVVVHVLCDEQQRADSDGDDSANSARAGDTDRRKRGHDARFDLYDTLLLTSRWLYSLPRGHLFIFGRL